MGLQGVCHFPAGSGCRLGDEHIRDEQIARARPRVPPKLRSTFSRQESPIAVPGLDDDDWVSGIAIALRQMLAAGAADDVIESFINARRSGHTLQADHLPCTTPQLPSHQPTALGLPPELAIALERLRIATLRPVVNRLDPATLFMYVEIILSITDQVVRSEQDHRCWSSTSFIQTMASALMNVALEHIKSESQNPAPRGSVH